MKRAGVCWWALCALVAALLAPARRAWAQTDGSSAFLQDIERLTRAPERQAGGAGGREAGAYIASRLRALGVEQVYTLDMPVWRLQTLRADLVVGDRTLPLHPLRPNVVVPPVTPPEGISAPLIYAAAGTLEEYGTRNPRGAIVVLDYASQDAWERAFALGAAAVIFLDRGGDVSFVPKHAGVPSDQVRLYASESELGGFDLRVDQPQVTVHSQVVWQRGQGTNIVARIPGTDARFAPDRKEPEALVVGVGYDSFGVVPDLARGARGAANVAAALELAGTLRQKPAKRDVLLLFSDNSSHGQQGAREVYAALHMSAAEAERLAREHQAELTHVQAMLGVLAEQGLEFDVGERESVPGVSLARWLTNALESQTDHARDDVRKELQVARLSSKGADEAHLRELDRTWLRWDELRRTLHEGTLKSFIAQLESRAAAGGEAAAEANLYLTMFRDILARTRAGFERRVAELSAESARDAQRAELRRALGFTGGDDATWIVLHTELSLSGDAPTWGAVAGDWSTRLFAWRAPKPEGDAPGYYGRVLNVIRGLEPSKFAPNLDVDTLSDPSVGMSFASDPFVSSGAVAGSYGIYNLTFLTGYDRRARDGHPADTPERMNLGRLHEQAQEAGRLISALASAAELSLPRVFAVLARSKYPSWNQGQSGGDYAGLQVSGSLSEDRPANTALMAMWPGEQDWRRQAWNSLTAAQWLPGFDPLVLEPVDQNGRFRLVGVRSDLFEELMTLGVVFDEQGRVAGISTAERQTQRLVETMRVNVFFANSGQWSMVHTGEPSPQAQRLSLLKASSDSLFRDNRALWGQLGAHGFFYISDQLVDYRIKLFQPAGDVALGTFGKGQSFGEGLDPALFKRGINLAEHTASDLWQLNESRLRKLRARGVTSADLEQLHGRAKSALEQGASAENVAAREAAWSRAAALSHRVYQPLRDTMDDLVHSIVILLLLTIPFAFSLERLLVGATGVYGRIGGFALMFLGTFGLLFWLHPGFAIAATPIIIFLAFAILLLSSLVIYIVVRKFKTELREIQGQSVGQHDIEVSRMGTLLAAIGMGMSTMRRRPTRTFLTAITVVILTFTILSFASFQRSVGLRTVYDGPVSEQTAPDLLLRKLDYSALPDSVVDGLAGFQGQGGVLAPHYWLVRELPEQSRFSLARAGDGKSLAIDAVMGVPAEQLERWPSLERSLGSATLEEKRRALDAGGVYLPPVVQDVLDLKPGDAVLINGQRLTFAGSVEGSVLQRIKHLDGQSLLPVDFINAASTNAGQGNNAGQASESERLLAEGVDRAFVHLSSDQVALASPDVVRKLGGAVYAVSIHAGQGVDALERARRLAEVMVMPVWARGAEGVERLVLTRLTDVSGGLGLFVPLLLGGLIIFGTLLGSINDREKEIYTFSALGLSPMHVGILFFAEAAVYACVGGVGGQLLAQGVGLGASALSEAGYIKPVSLNYSSTNALFATAVVMLTVLVSAIYPAVRASRSANPGLVRTWKMPAPDGDRLSLTFPFTVSAYDITGVVSFLAEHFRRHDDVGLGSFAASNVAIGRTEGGNLVLSSDVALAPFDLGVTQRLTLTAVPSEIEGVDEVAIDVRRESGAGGDWQRANRVFMRELRRQFLVWRTLSSEAIEGYREQTLALLGALGEPAPAKAGE